MHPIISRPPLLIGLFALVLVSTAACDSTEEADQCDIYDTCDVIDPLQLVLIEHTAELPANVSILFKVDTDEDKPVAQLTPGDFDLFENGQLISRFEADLTILPKTGQFQYSIVLLMDLSGSILASESLEPLKEAARRFVEAIMVPVDDPRYGEVEMGIWWFDGRIDIDSLVAFTVDPVSLVAAIDGITEGLTVDNSTNLYGAVIQGLGVAGQRVAQLDRQEVLSAGSVVLFTDGTDQANRVSRSDALRAVSRTGDDLSVYTIGLGGEIDEQTLEEIGVDGFASAANLVDLVPRFQEIADLVRDEARSYYLLEYCSPKRNGMNELGLRVSTGNRKGVMTTRFSAEGFTSGCSVSE
jgi:hypothetical protein